MSGYDLSRFWFSFAYENPEVKPVHTALFFWIVERANASGWKKIIDIQTEKSMDSLGITDWRTYKNGLQFLADNKVILWVEKSRNQFTCNKVTLLFEEAEIGDAYKNAYTLNAEPNVEAIAEAIAEAYAEAHVEAIAEALQSYINLKTNKPINKQTPKPASASEPEGSKEGSVLKETKYERFLKLFNGMCKREFKTMNEKAQRQLDKLLKKKFTKEDFTKAILNGFEDSHSWTRPGVFTPEYITREHVFEKYLYMDPIANNEKPTAVAPAGYNIQKMLEEQQNKIYR